MIRATNTEIIKHVNEKVQQNFQILAETLFTKMEHYITTKMEVITKEMRSEFDLKNKFSAENVDLHKHQVIFVFQILVISYLYPLSHFMYIIGPCINFWNIFLNIENYRRAKE